MSVLPHEDNNGNQYWRVARMIGGKREQQYFPRTDDGRVKADNLDIELKERQKEAARNHVGKARRWHPDAKGSI